MHTDHAIMCAFTNPYKKEYQEAAENLMNVYRCCRTLGGRSSPNSVARKTIEEAQQRYDNAYRNYNRYQKNQVRETLV